MRRAMTHTGTWLVAAVVVGGLFLLHGMTADHSLPMPMAASQAQVASALVDSPAVERGHGDHAGLIGGEDGSMVVAPAYGAATAVADGVVSAKPSKPARHVHGIAGTCLALLAAVILLQLAGQRRRRNGYRSIVRDVAYVTWGAAPRAPPWMRAPSPTRLCISRT
ncbi:MAG: hypothetical protein WAK18_18785 [Nocardioidaceae bacterium]